MTNQVNKDILIAVMSKQLEQSEKMVKLQKDQLNNYREQVETYKALMGKYEQEVAANKEALSQVVKMLDVQTEDNIRLISELQELKQYTEQLEQKMQAPNGNIPI
jgi:hypothetical protein